jgi:hypothetical protein
MVGYGDDGHPRGRMEAFVEIMYSLSCVLIIMNSLLLKHFPGVMRSCRSSIGRVFKEVLSFPTLDTCSAIGNTITVPFAETNQLRIRGYQECDCDKLVSLFDDPRSKRSGPEYINVKPMSEVALTSRKDIAEMARSASMLCFLEAEQPLEDGNDWVGFISLSQYSSPKNRDAVFGIILDARHHDVHV